MPNTYSCLYVHIVFSTAWRRPAISESWMKDLWSYMGGICRARGATPVAIGGIDDHGHILTGFRPTHRLCDLVRDIKGGSSGWIHENCHAPTFQWQGGYAIFSVSASLIDKVKKYIEQQEEHHQHHSSKDELRELLRRHGIEFDEKYLE